MKKDNLVVGKPQAQPDTPAHIRGVKAGNAPGRYEQMSGHLPDGRSDARRSTGIEPAKHDPIDPRMPNLSPP